MSSLNLLPLMLYAIIITFKGVFGHDALDWFTVASRTCPHESDMEQRLSELFEAIYFRSSNNAFFFPATSPPFGDLLKNRIFSPNDATIVFPSTIKDSAPYFTRGEHKDGLIDTSKHNVWYNMDIIQNGGPSDATSNSGEAYGVPSTVSFEQFLSELSFTIDIVPGSQHYWCDDSNAYGSGAGTVFIKQRECDGKAYIGRVQIATTFENITNFIGNDEWMLDEFGIFWEMYSQQTMECDSSDSSDSLEADELSLNASSWEITLSLSNALILSMAIILVLILLCGGYMVYRINCKSVKHIDSEYYDSEHNSINI